MSRPRVPAFDRHVAFWRRVGWTPASLGEFRASETDAATFVVDANVSPELRFPGLIGVAEIIEKWLHSGQEAKAERAAQALVDYFNRVRTERTE